MNNAKSLALGVMFGSALMALPGSVTVSAKETPALLVHATDAEETLRVSALRELGKSRDPAAIPVLLNALEDRFAIVQQAAVSALIDMGAPAWPAVREQVGSTNIARRAGAVRVLAAAPDLANAEALGRALRDEVWDVREPAIEGVVRLGALALDRVLPLAREKQGRGPESALRVLARWGAAAKAAEPVALAQLSDEADLRVRRVAAYALMQIGPDVEASLPRLRELWPKLHGQERLWLALGLARQGATAQAAADLLEQELARAEAEEGVALAAGLVRMGPAVYEGIVTRLRETVQSGEKRRAFKAIMVLGWFGPQAQGALPVVLQELKAGRDPWFSMQAADALGAMGPVAKDAVPLLVEIIKKARGEAPAVHPELAERAAATLHKLDPAMAAALAGRK